MMQTHFSLKVTMFSFALVFLCVLHLAKNELSPFSRKTLEESWEEQLMKDLKSRENVAQHAPNETTEISVHYFLKRFTMGEEETSFTAYSWLMLSWNDPRLKWKPEDYYGISEIVYSSFTKFWEPNLRLLNEEDMEEYDIPYGLCSLDKDGDIVCIPRVLHKAPCHTKLSNWPYDVQTCTVQMGLYDFHSNINIKKIKKIVTLFGAEYGGEWTVLNYTTDYKSVDNLVRKSFNGSQLDVTFLLVREGEGLGAIVVFPIIILTVLTLSSFLLSVKENLRVGMICFNLLCHFLFLTELSDLIPKHSEDSPTILFYLRDSVMINVLLVLFAMFLIILRKKTVPLPSWISVVNRTVLKDGRSYLIWPRWKADRQDLTDEEHVILSQWADFSDMVNSFCFWLVIFLYSFYICVYVPRPAEIKF